MGTSHIAFMGGPAAGKTWCADYLVKNHGYRKFSFSTKLKEIASDMFPEEMTQKNRPLLQALGQDFRKYRPSVWVDYVIRQMQIASWDLDLITFPKFTIDDLRFPNEAEALEELGFVVVLVTPETEKIRQRRLETLYPDTPASAYNNIAEVAWKDIPSLYQVVSNETAPQYLDNIVQTDWSYLRSNRETYYPRRPHNFVED